MMKARNNDWPVSSNANCRKKIEWPINVDNVHNRIWPQNHRNVERNATDVESVLGKVLTILIDLEAISAVLLQGVGPEYEIYFFARHYYLTSYY
jgi:hypothetical protein